ncbi:MAG: type II toxin-antitoxin system RelB/DinJ family antitoxin [Lachnospiraceae bacterium]|jgi:DNA-damage-inducible protein J|nr:type II toxin-antitoxin system RelB/DinJ family antitoxin [Lachnospiraceae bacterium]
MAQTTVSIRMEDTLKKDMEKTCEALGMNMTTAFIIYAKKVTREKRIPFDVSLDPFYSEENMMHLSRSIRNLESGNGSEHDIIED